MATSFGPDRVSGSDRLAPPTLDELKRGFLSIAIAGVRSVLPVPNGKGARLVENLVELEASVMFVAADGVEKKCRQGIAEVETAFASIPGSKARDIQPAGSGSLSTFDVQGGVAVVLTTTTNVIVVTRVGAPTVIVHGAP